MTAKFQIFQSAENDRWYWRLRAENGEIILKTAQSNGFPQVQQAKEDVSDTRDAIKLQHRGKQSIERKFDVQDKPYFHIVDQDGDILAVSESYSSVGARAKGIDSVLLNAPSADIEILQEKE